jgi:hypothetical protein
MQLDLKGLKKTHDADLVNNGVWKQLEDTEPNDAGEFELLYLDPDTKRQPQRVRVRSARCHLIREAENKLQKAGFAKLRLARKKKQGEVIAEHTLLPEKVRFGLYLAAVENLGTTPGVQEVTPADAEAIFDMSEFDWLVQQVREIAMDDENYQSGGTGEVENPTSKATKSKVAEGAQA